MADNTLPLRQAQRCCPLSTFYRGKRGGILPLLGKESWEDRNDLDWGLCGWLCVRLPRYMCACVHWRGMVCTLGCV